MNQGRIAATSLGSTRQVTFGPAATHNEPCAITMAPPPAPAKRCTTRLLAGSMRVIGTPGALIQTDPSPAARSPPAIDSPTAIVVTSLFDLASMRLTDPSPRLSVHTAPSPTTIRPGRGPTLMVSTIALV